MYVGRFGGGGGGWQRWCGVKDNLETPERGVV